MTSVIERVKQHFHAKGMMAIDVPEWAEEEGGDFKVWFTPLTLDERRKIRDEDHFGGMVSLVIIKAKDSSGNKLFSLADKFELLKAADGHVVGRIANAMLGTAWTVDTAAKN